MSRYPEISERKISVIGVYIAWRGEDITLPVAKFLTFWSRKSTGGEIAAENGCLATISELALAARAPGTGQFFPIGTGVFNLVNLRAHWDRVSVPGSNGQKISEREFNG